MGIRSMHRHSGDNDLQIPVYNARFPGKYENALEGTMRFHGHWGAVRTVKKCLE
jgi:hypothetical protein